MTAINLTTQINAPIDKCFDLSRDIDIHLKSTAKTKERAVAGRTTGLCELNDIITWEAIHFGIKQNLTVQITKFDRPYFFEDKMLKGAFKTMRHEHHFEEMNNQTMMKDIFEYEVPFWFAGWLFNKLILKRYMTKFLLIRNNVIKSVAENK